MSVLYNIGMAIARNLSVVINPKPWVDTDMSQRKVHVLQRKMLLFSFTGKAFELMISLEIGRGIGFETLLPKVLMQPCHR